ncbi:prolipoprotein diacylglyceryl transferase [Nocardioides sp. NPDC057772]|jgi:prolipoprotein diacylglyceryl transferase|uniref:prolipoprotein diacylglyceryl transferase n=1 Tax=unclassified Nocardioides TaxID=2615069 RepID=UPI0002DA32F8|nr:prolipoprotein diacylglyceryl transferase [Nocardioides sp. NBC_00368]
MTALYYIPSPSEGVWHIGLFPVRAYALCIIAGIIAAVWLAEKRWTSRGGQPGRIQDIALWAIPFGIIGGRLYHVITDPELYFGEGRRPIEALYIWHGGLGVWGAIFLGALGAWIGVRRAGAPFGEIAGVIAPAIPLAQAIGRWGNWWNQELFGRPTQLPWGLQISPDRRPDGYESFATFHPTFLYESLWDLGVVGLVLWVEARFKIAGGRLFAIYVMGYTAGRGWIEYLRIDTANHVLGLRLNVWTSIIVFVAAATYFALATQRASASNKTFEASSAGPVT